MSNTTTTIIATVTIVLSIFGTGITLGQLIIPDQRELNSNVVEIHRDIAGIHRDISGVHRDVAELRERMARIEGLFEGFTKRESVNANS